MDWKIIAIIAVSFFVLMIFKKISSNAEIKPPYYRKKKLLNEKEQVLFHRLIEAMPSHYVLAQVRLADIVGVKKGAQNWQKWFNKISRKSVDFVIVDKSLAVLACIELDGETHEREDRQKADESKDEALDAAGIPIIRIAANKLSSTAEIKALLKNAVLHETLPRVDS